MYEQNATRVAARIASDLAAVRALLAGAAVLAESESRAVPKAREGGFRPGAGSISDPTARGALDEARMAAGETLRLSVARLEEAASLVHAVRRALSHFEAVMRVSDRPGT